MAVLVSCCSLLLLLNDDVLLLLLLSFLYWSSQSAGTWVTLAANSSCRAWTASSRRG